MPSRQLRSSCVKITNITKGSLVLFKRGLFYHSRKFLFGANHLIFWSFLLIFNFSKNFHPRLRKRIHDLQFPLRPINFLSLFQTLLRSIILSFTSQTHHHFKSHHHTPLKKQITIYFLFLSIHFEINEFF